MATVIDIRTRRVLAQPPEALCEPGTVTCGRCACETLVAQPAGKSVATCPVCGANDARFEPFDRAIEWVPVSISKAR